MRLRLKLEPAGKLAARRCLLREQVIDGGLPASGLRSLSQVGSVVAARRLQRGRDPPGRLDDVAPPGSPYPRRLPRRSRRVRPGGAASRCRRGDERIPPGRTRGRVAVAGSQCARQPAADRARCRPSIRDGESLRDRARGVEGACSSRSRRRRCPVCVSRGGTLEDRHRGHRAHRAARSEGEPEP